MEEEKNNNKEVELLEKSNEYNYIYGTESIDLFEITKSRGVQPDKEDENLILNMEFHTNLRIPASFRDPNNSSDLDTFLYENTNELDGVLLYYENTKVVRTVVVENGFENSIQCNNPHDGHCDDGYPLRHECSYDGIQDCVQHAVYELWSTYTALKCTITGGFYCILDETASCIESNCVG